MIDLPSGVPVPKPIDGKEADGVAKGIAQIHLKGDVEKNAAGEVVHRNSVTTRDSQSNLAAKGKVTSARDSSSNLAGKKDGKLRDSASNLAGKKDVKPKIQTQSSNLKKSVLSSSGHFNANSDTSASVKSLSQNDEASSSAGSNAAPASGDASQAAAPQSSSTGKEESSHPLKSRFLSFSKRIKGTVAGFSHSDLPKAKASAQATGSPTTNTVDLKIKNNSNAKLPTFNNNNAPSASAYDISLASNVAPQLPKSLDDYYVIRRVGKGGFATVFLVRLKQSTGRYFALKVIKKSEVVRLKQEKQIMNEKNILLELKHPLLIDLYNTFQTPSNLFMVLEFVAGGDLFTLLRKSKKFSEPQAKFYVCEVLTVLEYLHSLKVVYRDLKPENILLDSTGHIKLADFGFAKRLTTTTNSFCGTPDYIAAEIVASKPYSFPVDWWSLGVLVFELTSGKTPFRAEDSEGIYTNIQVGKVQWVPEVTGPIKDLCEGLLETEPKKRLGYRGAEEIKKSLWFSDVAWEKIGHRGVNPPVVPLSSTPETLEMEKLTKGGTTDYRDILGDSLPNDKFTDPYDGAFKGF